jgi:hypothetical protein
MPLLSHIVLITIVRPHDIVVHLAGGLVATIHPHSPLESLFGGF